MSQRSWDRKRFEQLFRRVQGLGETAGRAGLTEISESAFSLEIYLSTFSGDDNRPSLERAREVSELIQVLDAAVQSAVQAAPAAEAMNSPREGSVYCLLARADLVPGLDKMLEASQWRCVMFRDVAQLSAELDRGWPSALVLDASLLAQATPLLEGIRKKPGAVPRPLPLVFVSPSTDIKRRLAAMRVGADAYYTAPVDTESVVRRISQLAKVGNDAAYRVLVVEDDPSQAKFAATILRKGGMETEVVTEPLDTMGAIKRFKPDLVLMDVYMPNASGIELTRIIRQDKRLLTLPIVYLSGEQNPEKQQTALSVGADDFIAKPIRPKHLIGTVTNRIRRAQQLQDGLSEAEEPRTDPATGLTSKQYFFECIDALLSGSAGGDPPSAMVHIDIADFPALRTQLSGGALDSLLSMVGKRISNQLNPGEVATRSAENSFALLLRQPTGGSIRPVVDRMVRSLAEPPFEIDGRPLRLKASSKLWPLHRGDTAPGAASPTGERAATPGANVPGAPATARNRDAMIAQVREAIKAGRLELGLRQISGPEGQTPRGYELAPLVPADGATPAIPAQEVRRIAAEAGLIGALDRYSVARAIAFLDDPRGPGERTLLVRVSPRAMMEPESLQALRDGLRVRHLVGSGLVFGLSLAEIGADPKAIRSLVRTLKEMGIATALTRFTGSEAAMRLLTFLEAPYVEADVTVVRKGTAALAPLVEAAHRAGALVMMAEDWVPQGTKRSASYGADLWVGRSVRPPAAVAGDAIGSATD